MSKGCQERYFVAFDNIFPSLKLVDVDEIVWIGLFMGIFD
jgi:hypothetical protein